MNLDEFAKALNKDSNERRLSDLALYVEAWKSDDRGVNELETMVERFIGNTWLPSEKAHSNVYGLWETFKRDAILGIDGMTMNERLDCFGLNERFYTSKSEQEKNVIYRKLLAKP